MSNVEFVSYDGSYPNLCSGTLVISVDGVEWTFHHLHSGGSVSFDEDWNESIGVGEWEINDWDWPEGFPDDPEIRAQVVYQVNLHVEQGCCGGCV